jgi:uncharacterized protein (DUF433 family)
MTITIADPSSALRLDESGTIRIGASRVTLDTLIGCYQRGETPEQIRSGFPTLPLADIYAAIAYYLRHQGELDAYLDQRQREAEQFIRDNPHLVAKVSKQELLARRDKIRQDLPAGESHGA